MVHDPLRTGRTAEGQPRTPAESDGDRVAKALARAGVASRREVEKLIAAGRVALNGIVLTTPAIKVEAGDILTVDGEVVGDAEPTRLFRYYKPVGLMTAHSDPQGRPTVFGNLPEGLPRLISVGRLDFNTEGLLLLTNDGELARALELPATGLPRRYRARAHGRITQDKLSTLKDGVTVEGVRYGPIEATLDKAKEGPSGANVWITVTLAEGKNREVRRVLEHLGLKVNRLMRLSYGPFVLGTLRPGEVEEIGPRVLREQMADHITPENMPKGDKTQYQNPNIVGRARREAIEGVVERRVAFSRTQVDEPQAKKVYKAGWAKAKPPKAGGIKDRPKAKPKIDAMERRPGGAERAKAERIKAARTEGDRIKSAGTKSETAKPARAKPIEAKRTGPRPAMPRSAIREPAAPKPNRLTHPPRPQSKPEAASTDAKPVHWRAAPKAREAKPAAGRGRGPRVEAPRTDTSITENSRVRGPKADRFKSDKPKPAMVDKARGAKPAGGHPPRPRPKAPKR